MADDDLDSKLAQYEVKEEPSPGAPMRQRFTPIAAREQTPEQKQFQLTHVVPGIQKFAEWAPLVGIAAGAPTITEGVLNAGRTYLGGKVGEKTAGSVGGTVGKAIAGPTGEKVGRSVLGFLGGLWGGGGESEPTEMPTIKGPTTPYTQWPTKLEHDVARAELRRGMRTPPTTAPRPTGPATQAAAAPAEMPSVMVAPEPRAPLPTEKPGAAWSQTGPQLRASAQSGQPEAANVLRQREGIPTIFTPRTPDVGNIRERITIPEESGAPKLERESFTPNLHQITANVGGQHVGALMYSMEPEGIAKIDSSLMTNEFERQGTGSRMYDMAIRDAAGRGAKEIRSDTHLEPASRHMWEEVLPRKYPVEKVDGGFRIPLMTR